MSHRPTHIYRLDELADGEMFELRDNGVSYFGTVAGIGDVAGIDVLLESGRTSRRENWPSGTLVSKVDE